MECLSRGHSLAELSLCIIAEKPTLASSLAVHYPDVSKGVVSEDEALQ
jgi:hypothetical protein